MPYATFALDKFDSAKNSVKKVINLGFRQSGTPHDFVFLFKKLPDDVVWGGYRKAENIHKILAAPGAVCQKLHTPDVHGIDHFQIVDFRMNRPLGPVQGNLFKDDAYLHEINQDFCVGRGSIENGEGWALLAVSISNAAVSKFFGIKKGQATGPAVTQLKREGGSAS